MGPFLFLYISSNSILKSTIFSHAIFSKNLLTKKSDLNFLFLQL